MVGENSSPEKQKELGLNKDTFQPKKSEGEKLREK